MYRCIKHINCSQKNLKIRIYLAILAKLLELQRFNNINYRPSGQGMSQNTKNKYRKSTKSRDTINKTKAVKIVDDRTTTIFTLR